MPIRGVLFDVDDTLFDYTRSEETGILAHLRDLGLLERFPTPQAALTLWRGVMEHQYARYLAREVTFRVPTSRASFARLGPRKGKGVRDTPSKCRKAVATSDVLSAGFWPEQR